VRRPKLWIAGSVLVVCGAVAGVLLLTKGGSQPAKAVYGFNTYYSHYEVSRAESLVTESILSKEGQREAREVHSHGSAEVVLGAVDCRLSPPAPATNRLACDVSVVERPLFVPHAKVISEHRWRAVVTVNAANGALTLSMHRRQSR
jgi:hypothetical protein